jgi:t-SNARE complex subunit (syntaxin)
MLTFQSQDTLATSSVSLQAQVQRTDTGMSLEAITQRDREITTIAESITELADLFKDLSNLVIDQGTLLDRIDYNVEQMATEMEKAVGELNVATKYGWHCTSMMTSTDNMCILDISGGQARDRSYACLSC